DQIDAICQLSFRLLNRGTAGHPNDTRAASSQTYHRGGQRTRALALPPVWWPETATASSQGCVVRFGPVAPWISCVAPCGLTGGRAAVPVLGPFGRVFGAAGSGSGLSPRVRGCILATLSGPAGLGAVPTSPDPDARTRGDRPTGPRAPAGRLASSAAVQRGPEPHPAVPPDGRQ